MGFDATEQECVCDVQVAGQIQMLERSTDSFQQLDKHLLAHRLAVAGVREVEGRQLISERLEALHELVRELADFLQLEFLEVGVALDEHSHALDIESRALCDEKAFEIGPFLEERLPCRSAH